MATLLRCNSLFYYQLRKLHRSPVALSVPLNFNTSKNKEQFYAVLPEVMDSLMSSSKIKKQLPEVGAWLKKLLHHNIEGGKLAKGLSVPYTYRMLEAPEHFTEEKLNTARVLGWCLEMVYYIIIDDIIDVSTTRRGKPCWYLQLEVGSSAVNDSVLVYQCVKELLEIIFVKESYYINLIELINETFLHVSIGLYLDHWSGYTKEKDNIDSFTMERWTSIATNKTTYFCFRLPMLMALLIVKDGKQRDTSELCSICWELGKLLQFRNDYKDVYLDQAITGKAGTDIQEGKLSWIAVKAMELFNKEQRATFQEHYGSTDPNHVKKIRQLYDEIHLDKVYEQHERTVYDDLVRRILHGSLTEGETQFLLEILETSRKGQY